MSYFAKQCRLTKPDQFVAVFLQRYNLSGSWLKIHYKHNQLNYSRLGLVVSRNNHKRSHRRNYMKRVIRELFYQHQILLSGYDIVVRVKKCFLRSDYKIVAQEFHQLINEFNININY